MRGNVIVGQSGGPTAAINSSLAGVYRTAIERGAKKVYGMRNGIQGLLEERYIDLSEHITNDLDVELLKRTPAAYLGYTATNCLRFMKTSLYMRRFLKSLRSLILKHLFISAVMTLWIRLRSFQITVF